MLAARADDFTFGIEEEFFLINPRSRNLVAQVPNKLVDVCRQNLGSVIDHELLQSQIEISSPIFHDHAEALAQMSYFRRCIADVAATMDLQIIACGTPPLAHWPELAYTETPRYERVVQDLQMVARHNLLCGQHVHVNVPASVDRVQLMNRLMPWLPVFLALSASSPFWEKRRTGLLSYRQAAFDEWPRTGIPDFFLDEAEYWRYADLLIKSYAIKDAGFIWWAIRPSSRYPTLELRIADSCTHVEDSVALASLFRCLVRAHMRRPLWGSPRSAITRRVIDENRWRAKRYGTDAEFIDEPSAECKRFADVLEQMLALIAPDIDCLGCQAAVHQIHTMMARGSSAHEQLSVYLAGRAAGLSRIAALRAVTDWLIDTSVPGVNDNSGE